MNSVEFVPEFTFIKHLASQVRAGFGIVPFVGSGCSSASGILMGGQFNDYLAWTVCVCVADRRQHYGNAVEVIGPRWNLREAGWPPFPSETQIQFARSWVLREFCALAKACGLHVEDDTSTYTVRGVDQDLAAPAEPDALAGLLHIPFVPPFLRANQVRWNGLMDGQRLRQLHAVLSKEGLLQGGLMRPEYSPTSSDAIVERAIRSLYDWRATLHFLAELQLAPDGHTLFLVERDPAVIDGFNVHITQGRRPNFTHTMLCHLREPARARIVLTTNFDTLREAIRAHGAEVVFLPRYSPEFNPVEGAWSKLKAYLRKVVAHTPKALNRALARGLARITAANARGWFQHAGYKTT